MSALFRPKVTIGLYRHFKGDYFYVTGLSKSATDESTVMVNYFNICHAEYGSFVRPLDDFNTEYDGGHFLSDTEIKYIKDREDNVTGQKFRFERVEDLNFQLGSISTEQLIEELARRADSPLQDIDVDGLNKKVFCTDYAVGTKYNETSDFPRGVSCHCSFAEEEKAKKYFETHKHRKGTAVFKRVFIEVE